MSQTQKDGTLFGNRPFLSKFEIYLLWPSRYRILNAFHEVTGRNIQCPAILKKVSIVGLRCPLSIALKCVRPMPASPLTISCDKPFSSRHTFMTVPTMVAFNMRNSFFLDYTLLIHQKWIQMLTNENKCVIMCGRETKITFIFERRLWWSLRKESFLF